MSTRNLWAVVMAGGSGTRFWPASRRAVPKQFLPITGGRSMLARTVARLRGAIDPERVLVVTGADHAELVRRHLPRLPPGNVLAEPSGRNTGPCVAWAAQEIHRRDPDSVHAVLPSDHVIAPASAFRRALAAGADDADASGSLLTFGIRPSFPATGYGWIEAGGPVADRGGIVVREVARFVEKPDRERAESFLASGRHLWNSGMFVWRTESILEALERHAPDLALAFSGRLDRAGVETAYARVAPVSIDVAVLEKAANVRVLPVDFTWSDVGSWNALPDVLAADPAGNCSGGGGTLVGEDASGCVVWARKGDLTALLGVHDLVVVRSGKAVLVCPKDRAQDVRRIVERLAREDPRFL